MTLEKNMENKNKMEYANETFIQNFHKLAGQLKELGKELDKEEIFEELKAEINEIIVDFNDGKKIKADKAEKIKEKVRKKLIELKEMKMIEPFYEKTGSLIDDSFTRNKEKGITHRALVFKIGEKILVETGIGKDVIHEKIAEQMYAHNKDLFVKNNISLDNLVNRGGARLYVQKTEKARVAAKDDANDEDFLRYTEMFKEETLSKAKTAEERKEMEEKNEQRRENVLKEIISRAR